VHLRRRQADAVVLDHRVDHVVDQFLHDRTGDLRAIDRPGLSPEDRVAHPRDLQNRHLVGIILSVPCQRWICIRTTSRMVIGSARGAGARSSGGC
jgi:hypothetical protein